MDRDSGSAVLLPEAQSALHDSSRIVLSALDALPGEVCVLDSNGVVVMANKAWRASGTAHARAFWAVLIHADLTAVAREPVLFSASEGGVVLENLDEAGLERMRNMLLAMDPPRHVDFRRPLVPSFKAKVIGAHGGPDPHDLPRAS